jgi:MAternally affected uncoordination
MGTQSQFEERAYIALLGLAEHFRTTNNIKKSIQCLEAVKNLSNFHELFNFYVRKSFQLFAFPALSRKVEARTHLQIGQMLFAYTNNTDLAFQHLDKAWNLSNSVTQGQNFDDIKFDAAYSLSELYHQQNQSNAAKQILRKAIEISQNNIYWYSKFLFRISVSFLKLMTSSAFIILSFISFQFSINSNFMQMIKNIV